MHIRFFGVRTHSLLYEKVEGTGAQGSDDLGHHRGGCHEILPHYIHLPFRVRDDLKPWTGEFPLLFQVIDEAFNACFFRPLLNFFRARKSSLIYPKNNHVDHTSLHRNQRPHCVCPTLHLPLLIQITDFRFSYLPVMISRIMLSMRKAATSPQSAWSLVEPPTIVLDPRGVDVLNSQRVSYRGDEVPLDAYRIVDDDSVKMAH